MSINPALVQEMIAQDTHSSEQLKALLIQERQLLEARNHDPLPSLIEQKDHLLDRLSQSARQRQQLLQQLGLKTDADSWQELLKAHKALSPLLANWLQLRELFQECKTLNEVNGRMIARSRQTLGKLLNILRGQVGGTQLYNQSGTTTGTGGANTLAKA